MDEPWSRSFVVFNRPRPGRDERQIFDAGAAAASSRSDNGKKMPIIVKNGDDSFSLIFSCLAVNLLMPLIYPGYSLCLAATNWSSRVPHDLKVMGSIPVAVVSLSSWGLVDGQQA